MQASARHAGKCVFCAFRSHVQLKTDIRTRSQRFLSTATPLLSREQSGRKKHQGRSFRSLKLGRSDDQGDGPKPPRRRKNDRFGYEKYGPRPKFNEVLADRLKEVRKELQLAPIIKHLESDSSPSFGSFWRTFVSSISTPNSQEQIRPGTSVVDKRKEHQALRDAFYERGISSLDDRIKYAFYDHVTGSRFTESDIRNQKALADLRYPSEWFPATRTIHRTIHLHVGPTNSGKTYHALKRLEQASTGVYAGPLRLLAHEVYTRLNAKGISCTLITGEERRSPDDESLTSPMQSCTVEMMPLNKELDVAVIDEIQMIGNADRGWAWTQAVMGVKAKEVHLCGEARTVPLIRELCASVGEELIVHEYKRLSPLKMADQGLNGDLKLLQKGDCIVSFSVMGIHALRRQIEKDTGRKVATVYGSLPPETRAQQARLFNDPDNDYDFLVASDAIGMGLNLSIKRVIFESSSKFDGYKQRSLSIADIKQIGGRAGRYRSAHQANESARNAQHVAAAAANGEKASVEEVSQTEPESPETTSAASSQTDKESIIEPITEAVVPPPPASSSVGIVTTLEKFDFPVIAAAMKSEPEPIRTAGIFPPAPVIERFATYFPPGTPFSYILMRLHELAQVHSRFHLCGLRDQLWIADLIEPVQGLTTNDRNILCACPASKSESELFKLLIPAFARCIEQQSGGSLVDIAELPLEILEQEVSANRDYLRQLERLHKGVVAYLWLSYRFAGIFTTRPLAFHVKNLVEEKIEQVLSQFSFTEAQRRKIIAAREKSILTNLERDAEQADAEEEARNNDDDEAMPEELIKEVTFDPEAQTGYTAGGDRFSGEEDAVIMDPIEDAGIAEATTNPSNAAVVDAAAAAAVDGTTTTTTTTTTATHDLPPKVFPDTDGTFAEWRISDSGPGDKQQTREPEKGQVGS